MRRLALLLIFAIAALAAIASTANARSPVLNYGWKNTSPNASNSDAAAKAVRASTQMAKASAQVRRSITTRAPVANQPNYLTCGQQGQIYVLPKGELAIQWNADGSISMNPGSTGLPYGDPSPWYTGGFEFRWAPVPSSGYVFGAVPGVDKLDRLNVCREVWTLVDLGEVCDPPDPEFPDDPPFCYEDYLPVFQYAYWITSKGYPTELIPDEIDLPNGSIDIVGAANATFKPLGKKNK